MACRRKGAMPLSKTMLTSYFCLLPPNFSDLEGSKPWALQHIEGKISTILENNKKIWGSV